MKKQNQKRKPAQECLSGFTGDPIPGWPCFISAGSYGSQGAFRYVFQQQQAREDGSRLLRIVRVRWEGNHVHVWPATQAVRTPEWSHTGDSRFSLADPLASVPTEVLEAFLKADWEALTEKHDGSMFAHRGPERIK